AWTVQRASAQRPNGGAAAGPVPPPGSPPPDGWRPHTGPGYKNESNRLGANGPMDDTTRKIVKYVHDFKESDLTPAVVKAVNRTMVDSMAATIAGFEEEAVRIAARCARLSPAGKEKCTVFGYGITSTPELASFANSCMVRLVDFNDTPHNSNLIPAALAMGEALHSTGPQVMAAIVAGYEATAAGGGESVPAAMAVGKLMGLDEDRLANAVTLALTPHVALNKGVGAMSMWKGCRSAEAVKCGTWAAIMAREGMTGPPQPFEGRGGLWYSQGRMGRPVTLPVQAKLVIERGVNKRFPSDQMTQQTLSLVPQFRAWTKPDEIEWIQYDMTFGDWEECGDAPKWDPRNRDTADHSIPYTLARNLIDGETYLDAFTLDKLPYRDPVVRALMDKITLSPVREWRGNGTARITIHKKSGDEKYWDTHDGSRNPGDMGEFKQMSDEDITNKFKRVCAFRHVSDAQRDQALAQWWDLSKVKDIAEPMRTLATFGRPLPL
ncbi:MAG TPA: MmgE/PrpD family protein, partial [Vicinamibacterales bacterium]|nr:MmgE/PrpD family protein [Vicinamibacterales bacterium]